MHFQVGRTVGRLLGPLAGPLRSLRRRLLGDQREPKRGCLLGGAKFHAIYRVIYTGSYIYTYIYIYIYIHIYIYTYIYIYTGHFPICCPVGWPPAAARRAAYGPSAERPSMPHFLFVWEGRGPSNTGGGNN